MSIWLNNKKRIYDSSEIRKPCLDLDRLCPYGCLVEEFPLHPRDSEMGYSCGIFGHDCPVFYIAERI